MRLINRALILVLAGLLSGCGLTPTNSVSENIPTSPVVEERENTSAEFNPVEYMLFAQIEAIARTAKQYCDNPDHLFAQ